MTAEQKTCQNCKQDFTVEAEDFDFYKRLDVPPPTFCAQCRMQRRFAWRNERSLYRNKCAKTGEEVISSFHPDSGITIWNRDYWWSDDWDILDYGRDYDFGKSFFEQFSELLRSAPWPHVFNARTVDCEYTAYTGDFKDSYLVSASFQGENLAYGSQVHSSKDSMDLFSVADCTLCYEDVSSQKLYRTCFSQDCDACSGSWFLFDCKGCTDCFGCTGLRNKSYYIFNEPYSKEEYFKKLKEFNTGSYAELQKIKEKFDDLKLTAVRKYANIVNSPGSTGNNLFNAKNCRNSFIVSEEAENCRYIMNALRIKDSHDGYGVGANAELLYELFDSGVQGSRLMFGATIYGGSDVTYSQNCHASSNVFGCIGLRNKQYCILNKQYSKTEYQEIIPRIIEHMKAMPYAGENGRTYGYGEFFPAEISPFGYNETVAQDYFPLSKDEILARGFLWRDKPPSPHKPTVSAEDLEDDIKKVDDSILDEVISCSVCGGVYRIIKKELEFLRMLNVALPRACFECRHKARFAQVNPPKLWEGHCQCQGKQSREQNYENTATHFHGGDACPNEFETSYAPDRPEIVYCEQCYNAEVA